MSFIRDLEKSNVAVDIVIEYLTTLNYISNIKKLSKNMQHKGDIEYYDKRSGLIRCEIKFDIMAQKTGNLCFEASNGKKATGILTTQADEVFYVVPKETGFVVYKFITKDLVDFLNTDTQHIVVKNGGDKKKFVLMLVKREIAEELMTYEVVEV